MAFTRKFLADHGVPEEQIDAIMAERSRTLTDYIPKSDVQAQIDAAVAEAQKGWKGPDPTESDEYKALQAKYDMRVALDGDEYQEVKPKFREAVYNMIDRTEGAKPFDEQLSAVREKYEEYFNTSPEAKPQFSGEVKGSMPQGNAKPTLEDLWGYNRKR